MKCAPSRIRTCDLRIRSPSLYPAELPEQLQSESFAMRQESKAFPEQRLFPVEKGLFQTNGAAHEVRTLLGSIYVR